MFETDKLEMLKAMTGETDTNVLSAYLTLAKGIVISKAFPYGKGDEEVPEKYDTAHIEIAAYMINKRGAEGETSHNENGINRSYENGDIPQTLLRRITPMIGVLHEEPEEE